MDKAQAEALLKDSARGVGVELHKAQIERFILYMDILLEWNRRMNLTAVTEPRDIIIKHFADSLSLAPFITGGARVIDVGTGAGFPGVPLLISNSGITLTLLDSQNKRVVFLRSLLAELGLSAECAHARAEDAGRDPHFRERFDFAVSRAVSRLNALAELCLPFARPGGAFIAMKGPDAGEEMREARAAILRLGGRTEEIMRVNPGGNIAHTLIIVRKLSQTPPKYPRRPEKIAKCPLV